MIEEWKLSRKGGWFYSIPYPVTMLSQRRRGKGVLQGCELGTCLSAFQERGREREQEKKNERELLKMCTCECVRVRA